MTDREPTFTESCQQLSAALQQIARVLFPVLPYLARLVSQVLRSAIPAPIRRAWDRINGRWLDALLIAIYGASVALYLAVLVAKIAGWI